jgi:predicted phage terminase large subunit-like protein
VSRPLALVEAAARRLLESGRTEAIREAGRRDLYFLLRFLLRRADLAHQWLLDRCDEVQAEPDGHLDLWARGHYKSTIITFGATIQDILKDQETTACIFSHTRPNAKAFLRQVKRELEDNELLKRLYPDVLWTDPRRQSPLWSEDHGLIVRRRGNPKEATLEAWGVVDAQPTGKHYQVLVYDDVVSLESVGTPDMRAKVLASFEVSLNLVAKGARLRMLGTRWHYADAYQELERRGTFTVRRHPARDPDGRAVLMTEEELERRLIDLGPYAWSAQMMLDPKGGPGVGFRDEWKRTWLGEIRPGNRYLLVDPANSKRKRSDFTAMWLVECCEDGKAYVRDMVRDRLDLRERVAAAIALHRQWRPRRVGWEEYGLAADVQALRGEQDATGYRFEVVSLAGKLAKEERIGRLIPLFAAGRVMLPPELRRACAYSGRTEDLVKVFWDEEYSGWPYVAHDDMLDALSRLMDTEMDVAWPMTSEAMDDPRRSLRAVVPQRLLA